MTIRRALLVLQGMFFLAIGATASAQTDLTCDDIVFGAEVTSRYADIADGCWDVVELDGERYAKMKVEILQTRGRTATFRFKHPDGSFGPTQSTTVASDWRAEIGGQTYSMRQLNAGQEVNVYVPSDRWEAQLGDTSGVLTTYYAVVMVEESSSGSGAALPSTASALPLIGLLGVGSLFAAFLMRIRRRRDV